jgi:Flp pilus assembly protein TadB
VSTIASRERKRFESQLPDTLNLIATSLRAGYSLLQAVEAVGQESPEPTAREFARAITEIRLGRSVDAALNDVARRMESQDFEWAVLAINIQREVGGNLAEVLQTTAETMLQRNRLRREMKALTAEGRISAIVLGALPFVIFGVILVVNPTYIEPLLGTTQGLVALGVAAVLLVLGMLWLQKIVKVEV